MPNPPMIQPKLTPDQVKEIYAHILMARRLAKEAGKKLMSKGVMARLATKYSVSVRTIQHIGTRDRWETILGSRPKPRGPRKRILRPSNQISGR